jgi:hypothetical protein
MKGQMALSRTRIEKNLSQQYHTSYANKPYYSCNNSINTYNYLNNRSEIPEGRRSLCDPEFAFHCKEIHRRAVILMGFRVTIYTTQIGDEIVKIAVIFVNQRQWLFLGDTRSMPSVPGFDGVGNETRREAIVFTTRMSAETIT